MKKAAIILMVIGLIFFAGGIYAIYRGFVSQHSDENYLVFEKTVQARITDMRIKKSTVGARNRHGSGKPSSSGITTYYYCVTLYVSDDGGYSKEEYVPEYVYKEYEELEKNKDMTFNLYRNRDGAAVFSLKDLEEATADYQNIAVAMSLGYKMIAGLIAAAVGWVLMINGDKLRMKAAKKAKEEGY